MWNFWSYRRLSVYISDEVNFKHQLRTSELSYKHNVAATNGSSKPVTTNELWLLELWIESTRILASIPDALWDMCKSSIEKGVKYAHPCHQFSASAPPPTQFHKVNSI